MSFTGAILPAWQYHMMSEYTAVGSFFVAVYIGLVAALRIAGILIQKRAAGGVLLTGSVMASAALLYLSLVPPSANFLWRTFGMLFIGAAAGMLNTAFFHALSRAYRQDRAATVNLAGTFFGLGCLTTPALLAGTFNLYAVSTVLQFMAGGVAAFAWLFHKQPIRIEPSIRQRSFRQVLYDFRSPAAVLFALLLFFQFGNEWAIAGWLPLFLIQRLGMSPSAALLLLTLYWTSLMVGRITVQYLLTRLSHRQILLASVLGALFGCTLLAFTNNLFGAIWGLTFVGFGFASIYPLVAERIAAKFPYYHPGLFNGIFSLALTGGLLAPWSLGFLADSYGVQIVMALPFAGTIAVLLLLVLIRIEAWMTGER
jgi:FHS family glucose/mannose:H+ symporter-like MFS transporter